MEAETKEIIKEKEYVRGRGCGYGYWDGDCYDGYGYRRHGVDSGARALGIVGTWHCCAAHAADCSAAATAHPKT